MPQQVEQKTIDPEAELSNVQRMFKKLAPMCSVEKRAAGIPQLAPQEKQLGILTHELKETRLCINLARKGQHAIRDSQVKQGTLKSIVEYEHLMSQLRDENAQQAELDCLNYLAQKQLVELFKKVPTEADELGMIENAANRLRRMENRLDLATKRFCVINDDNKRVREEIHRLLVERNGFNIQWNRTIGKLVKGKEYLMDIFEISSTAFGDRDECCRKLEALKWKGLYQLNRDISYLLGALGFNSLQTRRTFDSLTTVCRFLRGQSDCPVLVSRALRLFVPNNYMRVRRHRLLAVPAPAARTAVHQHSPLVLALRSLTMLLQYSPQEMQSFEGELNHLAKLEEFLRVKGSRRICEADEKEEIKRLEEVQRCEQEVAHYDELLEQIFAYAGSEKVSTIINHFQSGEIQNFSTFVLLCEVLQESIIMRRDLELFRQRILDQRDMNEAREEKQDKRIAEMTAELEVRRARTQHMQSLNDAAVVTILKVLRGIDELVRLAKCDITPLLSLLGNHKEVTKWNVSKFLRILEAEVQSLIEVVYGAVKPPAPTPTPRKGAPPKPAATKLVADPFIEDIRPNRIEKLVPYQPCAYCVEDYIMNLVFETPAIPADKEYIEGIFRLEDVNTKFGIYTLTIPAKRHPYRGGKKE